jgi:large subunit ribosomal protein L22
MARETTAERTRVRAQAKWVRMSARKARVVLDNVRDRTVPEARTVLAFTPRAAAREIDRVLASAVANAESAHGLDGDELVVLEAYADEGPTLKRGKPRARGRYNRIMKRTCHITVVVAPSEQLRPSRPRKASAPQKAEAPSTETSAPATEPGEKPKASRPRKPKTKETVA